MIDIRYSIANGTFIHLKSLFGLVHGTPESLEPFVPFLLESTTLVDSIISVGNDK
jgi:hypothetical protein